MLQRAKRLSKAYDEYCSEHNYPQFKLDTEEWRQVDYLLCITQPFHQWTTAISKIKDVTIHQIFRIYNKLFDHFDFSISQLKRKRVPWKATMRGALEAGRQKLSDYYSRTDAHGNLYAIGTILAPRYKLRFFSKREWSDNNYQWRKTYRGYIEKYLEPYQQRQKETQQSQFSRPSTQQKDDIELLLDDDNHSEPSQSQEKQNGPAFDDELTHYLNSGIFLLFRISVDFSF
jgi:hypothetical protein